MLNHVNVLYVILIGTIAISAFSQSPLSAALAVASIAYILKNQLDIEAKKEPIANKDLKERLLLTEEKISKLENKMAAYSLRK